MGIRQKFSKRGYMILDTSYYNHYMIGRAYKIYKEHFDVTRDKKKEWLIDFSKDKQFTQILTACYVKGLNILLGRYEIARGDLIFALDCKRRDIWRIDLFSNYKISRFIKDRKQEGLNKGPLFKYINSTLFPYVTEKYNFGIDIRNPHAEGDDVIAVTKDYIRANDDSMLIVIIANDSDIIQLHDKHTIIQNMEEFDLYKRAEKFGSVSRYLTYKIIRGDTSDDIPSCFTKTKGDKVLSRGCGEKTATKLIETPQLLREKFKQYPNSVKQYRLNQQLIDFRYIPDIIKNDILEIIEEKFEL